MAQQTQIDFTPGYFEMASSETLPLSFDMANLIGSGDTITSPSATLTKILTNVSYPAGLSGSPSTSGTVLTQTITALVAGERYRLTLSFTANTNKIWSGDLVLFCPF